MPSDQTRTIPVRRHVEPTPMAGDADEPSPLLAQAQGWADIAREAHQECAKGDKAEKALLGRRNTPGQ